MNLKSFQNRLLDLSRMNNLINFKDRLHTSLELMADSPQRIYESLFKDTKLEVFNIDKYVSKFSGEKDLSKSDIAYEDIYPQVEKYITRNQILLYKRSGSVINVLKNLIKKNNEALTEKGLNILYMSFGLINYEENGEHYMAPLVLVPIKIESSARVYKISLYEEECTLNPNFKYKLLNEERLDIRNITLDENIEDYISYVNQSLKPTGYYCDDRMFISLFSFNKINMYQDLIENEKLITKNNIIQSLLNDLPILNAPPANLDIDPMCIVDVDHTQLKAIEAIRRGESIVLEGPPGTGKSQTITNIISSAIYDGKKVLFVSEKLAALNVVYDKLLKNDLGDFTLPLHSAKTNKKVVINDLYDTLFKEKTKTSQEAKKSIKDTIGIENILNDYANTLHNKINKYNLTPYEIFTNYSISKSYKSDLEIDDNSLNYNYYKNVYDYINDYKTYKKVVEYDYRECPFYLIKKNKITSNDLKILKVVKEELSPILKNINDIDKLYNFKINNLDDYIIFYNTYNTLVESPYFIKEFFNKKHILEYIDSINLCREDSEALKKSGDIINKVFNDNVYSIDNNDILDELLNYKKKIFKSLRPKYRRLMHSLIPYTKNGRKPKYLKALLGLTALKDYRILSDSYNKHFSVFDNILDKNKLDYTSIIKTLNAIKMGYRLEGFKYFKLNKEFILGELKDKGLKELYSNEIYKIDIYKYDIKLLFKLINRSINVYDLFDSYRLFETNVLNKLNELNAVKYLDFALDNKYDINELYKPFDYVYYNRVHNKILEEIPAFKEFNILTMNKMVDDYKSLDRKRFDICKSIIRESIQKSKPNPDEIAKGSFASIIKREYLKKRRQMTIREIINADPTFIKTLKPIFLMSPLSVSSYLTSNVKFDLVIFDEASQVYPEDAIGAIYRASQVVICGDSRQMPPTSFFKSNVLEEGIDDGAGDYESILDMAKASLNVYSLKWHYRSKCEELIAFSNKYIYNSMLTTFPSATKHKEDFGLELYKVSGIYDKNSRTNEIEASKVIELIDEHYKKYKGSRSIGVVAFSISQQHLIERKFNEYKALNNLIDNKDEPIFIKNLETVQGDERDTIIFSIGYGYDSGNKFIQNFGPLNRSGGERRLNVAISRAKIDLKVVSSITDSDITDSNVVGVSLLKKYLAFAKNPIITNISDDKLNPDFSYEVKEFLEGLGYSCDYMVGFSNKKIDICIKDKNTGDYIIAIECDGKTYYDSENARDRNRLRCDVLTSMGFKYIRVYSVSWYKNIKLCKKVLLDSINESNDKLSLMQDSDYLVNTTDTINTFNEYIYSPDDKIIALYKSNEISFYDLIKRVLDNESPINEAWFVERFKDIFDGASNVYDEYELQKALNLDSNEIESYKGYLMYKNKKVELRVPYEGSTPRDIKYISSLEIAYGMKELIIKNNGLIKEDLFHHIQVALGYKRMNAQINKKLEEALEELDKITIISKKDGKIMALDL